MGLGNFKKSGGTSEVEKYRQYGHREYNLELESMVDELQEQFPEEIEVGFIEVSPEMTKTQGFAYYKPEGNYIRIAEKVIESHSRDQIKRAVAHEMVHLWMHQIGREDISDEDRIFNWALGVVLADVSGYHQNSQIWEDIAEPMIEHHSD